MEASNYLDSWGKIPTTLDKSTHFWWKCFKNLLTRVAQSFSLWICGVWRRTSRPLPRAWENSPTFLCPSNTGRETSRQTSRQEREAMWTLLRVRKERCLRPTTWLSVRITRESSKQLTETEARLMWSRERDRLMWRFTRSKSSVQSIVHLLFLYANGRFPECISCACSACGHQQRALGSQSGSSGLPSHLPVRKSTFFSFALKTKTRHGEF